MTLETTELMETPTEVLIPEARARQRRRHVRFGIALALSAFLVIALTAAAVVLFGPNAGGNSQAKPPAVVVTGSAGTVYFRPVLCTAPPYNAGQAAPTAGSPSCSAASALTTKNLNVEPISSSPAGFTSNNLPPDLALAGVPSTKPSAGKASATELLPALSASGNSSNNGERYVLGPAEMSSSAIKYAVVKKSTAGQWDVYYTTTARGAVLWDHVAKQNFHGLLAIDLRGVVYSAPIIQPTQASFSSFKGRGQISGNLTKADAERLANALSSRR